MIATVGTAGATAVTTATTAGATAIPVASGAGFAPGQTITIDTGGNQETAVVTTANFGGRGGRGGAGPTITVTAPLKSAHAIGAQVSGSGITLTQPLTKPHGIGTQIASDLPTPGAPNKFRKRN